MARWKECWPEFEEKLREKLDRGHQQYGDGSFDKPLPVTMREITEELIDICGWSVVAWHRMKRLEAALKNMEEHVSIDTW